MKVFLAKIWVDDAPYPPTLSTEGVFGTHASAERWMTENGLLPTPDTTSHWEHPSDRDIYGSIVERDVC